MIEEVAVYCRLSKEDENKGVHDDSDSIANQKKMLTKYVHEHGWQVYDYYVDDDFKGSDRNRPDFNRMISDLMIGPPKIVVCKKQARFARDIELVEKYIHGVFLEKGIRFIAILDGIDTLNATANTRKSSQINSLVDEWYLADLSQNVSSSLKILQEEGKFIGSYAPYGYLKDPKDKHHLIIDTDTVDTVRWIFNEYAYHNKGLNQIIYALNKEEILNPYAYKRSIGMNISVGPKKTLYTNKWTSSTLYYILHNPVYLGHIVQRKFYKPNYKSKKLIRLPKKDWVVVENCHEPIIDKDTWDRVGMMAEKRRSGGRVVPGNERKKKHHYSGILYCGECGSRLVASGGRCGSKSVRYLVCTYHRIDKTGCVGVRIRYDVLDTIVLNKFHEICNKYLNMEFQQKKLKALQENLSNNTDKHEEKKLSLERKIEANKKYIKALYQDKLDGIITKDEYTEYKNTYTQQLQESEIALNKLNSLLNDNTKAEQVKNAFDQSVKMIEKYKDIDAVSRTLIEELIEKITVSKGKDDEKIVTIDWTI